MPNIAGHVQSTKFLSRTFTSLEEVSASGEVVDSLSGGNVDMAERWTEYDQRRFVLLVVDVETELNR